MILSSGMVVAHSFNMIINQYFISNYVIINLRINQKCYMELTHQKIQEWLQLNPGTTSYQCQEGVTRIAGRAFAGCGNLETIVIPESVTSIGRSAFASCGLKSMILPSKLEHLDDCLFEGCSRLESIEIPEHVRSIGDAVFRGCSRLKWIVIPEGVTSIGNKVFYFCKQLSHIIAPEHLHLQLRGGYITFAHDLLLMHEHGYKEYYPDRMVMTQMQYNDALVKRIQRHSQALLDIHDKQKLAEKLQQLTKKVQHMNPAAKEALMVYDLGESMIDDPSFPTSVLISLFGDCPASILPLMGIASKTLAVKDNSDVGGKIVDYLTVRDKLNLDAADDLSHDMLGRPSDRTNRVIYLGQNTDEEVTPDLADQKSEEHQVDAHQSSSSTHLKGRKP